MVVRPALRRVGAGRLLVVAAVLLGMFLLQNAHCAAESGPAPTFRIMINSEGNCVAMSHVGDDATPASAAGAGIVRAAVNTVHAKAPHPAVQVTMACLAVFLALLTALAALLPPFGFALRSRSFPPVIFHRPGRVLPRALTLSQLCVLRT